MVPDNTKRYPGVSPAQINKHKKIILSLSTIIDIFFSFRLPVCEISQVMSNEGHGLSGELSRVMSDEGHGKEIVEHSSPKSWWTDTLSRTTPNSKR